MSQSPSGTSGNSALRIGALFGLGLGVVLIANYFLVQMNGTRLTSLAALVISLAVYLVAGLLAAARTGNVNTGLVAGLWAGLFSSVLNAAGVITLVLADHAVLAKLRLAAQQAAKAAAARTGGPVRTISDGLVIVSVVISLVLGILVATLVGLGLGALGGVIGKSRAPGPQAYREALYPGAPSGPPGQGS